MKPEEGERGGPSHLRVLLTGAAMTSGFQGGEPTIGDLLQRGLSERGVEVLREGSRRTLTDFATFAVAPLDVTPGRVAGYRRRLKELRPDAVLGFVDYDSSLVVAARKERVPILVCVHIYWPTCPVGTHYIEGQGNCFSPGLVRCVRHIARAPISPNLELPVSNLPAPIALLLYVKILERPAALAQADALVANSEFTATLLRNSGYERVHTIHNGVDTRLFGATSWSESRKVVLYPVARSRQERKGYAHFVEMARQVHATRPEVTFRILNDPGDEFIQGTPHLSREELARELRADYLAVVPSVWEEPFGLVAIEAMSVGRPVVAYRVGGLPEIIEDGVSGRLVPRGNVEELARAVRDLLDDEATAHRMGRAARERVEQMFDYELMVDRYLDLIRNLVSKGPQGSQRGIRRSAGVPPGSKPFY